MPSVSDPATSRDPIPIRAAWEHPEIPLDDDPPFTIGDRVQCISGSPHEGRSGVITYTEGRPPRKIAVHFTDDPPGFEPCFDLRLVVFGPLDSEGLPAWDESEGSVRRGF